MQKDQINSQTVQRDKHLSVHAGTYIAPDIEVFDIEMEYSILTAPSRMDPVEPI